MDSDPPVRQKHRALSVEPLRHTPWMVITVPAAPLAGLTDVIRGRLLLVHKLGRIIVILGRKSLSLSRKVVLLAEHKLYGAMRTMVLFSVKLARQLPPAPSELTEKFWLTSPALQPGLE